MRSGLKHNKSLYFCLSNNIGKFSTSFILNKQTTTVSDIWILFVQMRAMDLVEEQHFNLYVNTVLYLLILKNSIQICHVAIENPTWL